MNHKESARKAMSSLKIEGFEFDQESRKMWNEIENGRLTTHDAKRLIFEELGVTIEFGNYSTLRN